MQFEIFDLGLVDFKKASDFQRERFLALKSQRALQSLIICRHLPVIALGRRADRNNILASTEELKQRGIAVYEAERGGDVTYQIGRASCRERV
jgi:lipoyl(octanoyl) transferase